MIRYSSGLTKRLRATAARARFGWKRLRGWATGYPIYRPDFDHSVFACDNRNLRSTFRSRATIAHTLSVFRGNEAPMVLTEFEHPFVFWSEAWEADYRGFKAQAPGLVRRLCDEFDPARHHFMGSSQGCLRELRLLLARFGCALPDTNLHFAYWPAPERAGPLETPPTRLRVFHYARLNHGYKGTRDVFELARRLPGVAFSLGVDPDSPLARRYGALPNVTFFSLTSRRDYWQELLRSHVVLSPVYGCGWGMMLDALAASRPMIAYRSYDKDELIEDGASGVLIPLDPKLSLYDGFWLTDYANIREWGDFIQHCENESALAAAEQALQRYATDPALLLAHSRGTADLRRRRFGGAERIACVKEIYATMDPAGRTVA